MATPPTPDEVRALVATAKSLGRDFVHFTVTRRRAPRGSWQAIRLYGRTGPLSALDKECKRVGLDKDANGRRVELWSGWWRVRDLELWLAGLR